MSGDLSVLFRTLDIKGRSEIGLKNFNSAGDILDFFNLSNNELKNWNARMRGPTLIRLKAVFKNIFLRIEMNRLTFGTSLRPITAAILKTSNMFAFSL